MSEIPPTLKELGSFLQTATSKGWIGRTSGNAMLSTLRRVGPVMSEAEQADVGQIDIGMLIRRFSNLNRDVAASSLKSYTSRISSAIRMFLEWRQDPTKWKPRGASVSAGSNGKTNARLSKKKKGGDQDEPDLNEAAPADATAGGLSYPFPLRDGVIVKLIGLPRDLTEADVERISRFLRVLCVD